MQDSILNYLELNAHYHSIIAQIISDSIKDKDAPVDAIASTVQVCKLKKYEAVAPDLTFITQIFLRSIKYELGIDNRIFSNDTRIKF